MGAVSTLVPLIILTIVLTVVAFIGYAVYTVANDVADKTTKKMERKNVVFTKDGMKVGVKEVRNEQYVDQTQSFLVKAWNYSTWPAYKSRLWNKQEQEKAAAEPRKPYSRSASSAANTKTR
ncbi:MAG: hypothetical protein M1812_000978 [Candelaria pacifica]|nr:MAG: hypothetical protein M1812_000978 [Candelaria pacifica]